MTRRPLGSGGCLPPTLRMGTADVAYHLATRGRPLPLAFVFAFEGRAPTLDAVRARVAERAHRIPALRYRIARDRPEFRRVDGFAVEQHVHEVWLPEDADEAEAARLMLARPMNLGRRPPWDVWLVHGPDGGHSLCYRSDHAVQDGVGAAHTARDLLDDHPQDGPPAYDPSWPTGRGLAGALGDAVGGFRAPTAKPAVDGTSSGRTALCRAHTPLARLRAIGGAQGGTVNDVYLAALSHAVHTWHMKATGTLHPPLPVAIPMSVRLPGEECAPGNRMVTARFLLPCDEPSAHRALARVVAATARLRASRRRDAVHLLVAATPRALGARLGTRMVNGDVVAGPASGVNFGTALVHQGIASRSAAVFSDVASGIRLLTTLTSQHDTSCFTVVHDATLATADELPELWLAALLELERA
ncbi:wax ester/triacylglycerol synthase domain-containing protein [Streptomyces coerulescens]|uniref:Wax ester/triacylglycerol synthase domain-containing protein n=1 Tax=Streptomyces coerulescens TaxID=29304 RepID=A0ABW0CUD7_STRCD